MSKKVKAAKPEGEAKPQVQAKTQILHVAKKDAKFRGAREAWYKILLAHDGKPVNEYLESTTKTPPALTKNGSAENPRGWVRYFVRTGTATLSV